MSEYYEPGTGDRDARDFITIRREERRRGGLATEREESLFSADIGKFEKHTKVCGVMINSLT